jgi:hypothetical protein
MREEAAQFEGWQLIVGKKPFEDGYRISKANRRDSMPSASASRGRSIYRGGPLCERDRCDESTGLQRVCRNPRYGVDRASTGVCTTVVPLCLHNGSERKCT